MILIVRETPMDSGRVKMHVSFRFIFSYGPIWFEKLSRREIFSLL